MCLGLIHHVSENMILNQGWSYKYNNNENIYYKSTISPRSGKNINKRIWK